MQILLSNSQAGPVKTAKQEQEEISRNHVQAFILGSVPTSPKKYSEKDVQAVFSQRLADIFAAKDINIFCRTPSCF